MDKLRPLFLSVLLIAGSLAAKPALELSLDEIDFGFVPQKADFYHNVILRSIGDSPVKISEINTFCNCIGFPLEKMVILPGDSAIVRLKFNSSSYIGNREWRPHVYSNGINKIARIKIKAFIIGDVVKHRPVYVNPHTINASQFGSAVVKEFPLNLVNVSEEHVPLQLIYSDEEYFTLDFPGYISPNDTAVGKITLNEKGLATEFETYLTFEYIDDKSEKHLYSVPIRRRIFKPKE